jgi:hypothetical protein
VRIGFAPGDPTLISSFISLTRGDFFDNSLTGLLLGAFLSAGEGILDRFGPFESLLTPEPLGFSGTYGMLDLSPMLSATLKKRGFATKQDKPDQQSNNETYNTPLGESKHSIPELKLFVI